MIETNTSYPAYSHDQVKQAMYDLEVAKKDLEEANRRNGACSRIVSDNKDAINNVKTLIQEAFESDEFDKELVTNIAEALEIELTKDYDVTINVSFSGIITAPIGFDIDEIENYLNFEASENVWGSVDIETDLYSDGVDITLNN